MVGMYAPTAFNANYFSQDLGGRSCRASLPTTRRFISSEHLRDEMQRCIYSLLAILVASKHNREDRRMFVSKLE